MDASLICVLCERQWRREYGEHSPTQAQACLNGPVAALVKSGPRKGSRGTDAPVHFFSSPSLQRGVSEKGVFDDPVVEGTKRSKGGLSTMAKSKAENLE